MNKCRRASDLVFVGVVREGQTRESGGASNAVGKQQPCPPPGQSSALSSLRPRSLISLPGMRASQPP